VYNELGHGFLESVYQEAMAIALGQKGMEASRKNPLPVWFGGQQGGDFRADPVVNQAVIVELKAARTLEPRPRGAVVERFASFPHRDRAPAEFRAGSDD